MSGNRWWSDDELREMEQADPQLEEAARGISVVIARIAGRTVCPVCEGLGWFRDADGIATCICAVSATSPSSTGATP